LVGRRRQLVSMVTAERNRRQQMLTGAGKIGQLDLASSRGVGGHGSLRPQERTLGGRKSDVRTALYMAVITAKRYPGPISELYQRLRGAGKKPKGALTGCMRKLVIILNAMVKHHTQWNLSCAVVS
jgi:transposase